MKWITFGPEGALSVLTTDLCAVYGCDECSGVARARELPEGKMRDTGEAPPDPDATAYGPKTRINSVRALRFEL